MQCIKISDRSNVRYKIIELLSLSIVYIKASVPSAFVTSVSSPRDHITMFLKRWAGACEVFGKINRGKKIFLKTRLLEVD